MKLREKRVLKRNNYVRHNAFCIEMPSKVIIAQSIFDDSVHMYYPCGTKRWISTTWFDDINTDTL